MIKFIVIIKNIYEKIYLSIYLSVSLNGQSTNSQDLEKGEGIQRNASFNMDEIKVRWKKAALENCLEIPCVVTPPAPSFTCGTTTITDIDLNSYSTVSIGSQCWTTTNLKATKYNDGTLIGDSTNSTWGTAVIGARTEYVAGGVTGYVGTFGYLYNWYAVTDSRKLCPSGWHVPTDSDWNKLVKFMDSAVDTTIIGIQTSTAGTKMKKNDALWYINTGTDDFFFSVLPGGYRGNSSGSFLNITVDAFFWSATEAGTSAWYRNLYYVNGNVGRNGLNKGIGASVRCLRD